MEKKPFAHLHLHTEYSLLDGAVRIKELFSECKAKNISAVALTDHGNMYGAVKFVLAAKDYNKNNKDFPINPILGCEFYLSEDLTTRLGRPDMGHLVLLAKNQDGYNNLIKLTSVAFLDGFYYKPRIDYKLLKKHSKGLVCLSGCLGGHIQEFLLKGMDDEAEKKAIELKNIFGAEDFYMELQDHGLDEQRKILPLQIELAKKIGIKCAATNDVHYLRKDDEEAHDVLLCVQTGRKVAEPDRLKFPSNNFYLKDYNEMFSAFGNLKKEDITKALDNTIEIANKCNATIIFDQNLMPEHICEEGTDKVELLRKLVYEGINKKYGKMTDALKERADHEIEIISKLGFVDYFLVVWDYCAFCYQNNIPVGPGRGSGAGSIVAYALDITRIDPIRYQLKFERFLNKDRISPPDFDIDFCFNRTEEIIDYVTQKYGQERVSQIATFGTMKPKAAIKDVARALDVPFSEVNNLTKLMPSTISGWFSRNSLKRMFGQDAKEEENAQAIPDLKNIIANDPLMKKVVDIAIKVEGMPRHVSQHAAGVVICKYPISNFVPLAKSSGNIITQFDMKEIEKVGLLKYDFLRLRTLTDIQGAVDMVKESTGKEIDFYAKDFDMDDHSVYEIIASGETDTIFQLESGGMKKLMRDLKPDTLEDVIAGIALYRPGPMDWIPQFVTGKHKPETVKYVVPELEPILKDTYGVPVYQEQVMKICQELAGFTLSQADIIRRAMGKKEMENIIRWKKYFLHGGLSEVPPEIDGAIKKGFDEKTMSDLYDQLTKFADYAFNKSHSAGYAYLSYHTAYLKRYHEPESLAAVLNNRITNSDELKKYIALAKKRGIKVMPPDVNTSGVNFKVLDGKIYYGLGALKGIGVEAMGEVLKKRDAQCGGFKNFYNFVECLEGSALNKRFIESMIYSGALDCFGIKRSQMIDAYPEVVEAVVKDKKAKEDGQFSFFDEQFGMEDLKEVK
ncbi:MAG: DNA polymerase III subunit alpha, partial [Firmicutes bacterium]|nr:DNA polymerase III subunit alpha [Bacillota bacterium]